jgi:hypothetical protein
MDIEATRVDATAASRAAGLFDQRIAEQARLRTAIEVDPGLFDRYVGYYELHPRSIVTISREGDKLFAQLTGGPKRRLLAASEREYFYKFIPAQQFIFVVQGEEPATALILHQSGRELPSRRVDEARARATEARARELNSRRAEQERPRTAVTIDPGLYDRFAGLSARTKFDVHRDARGRSAVRSADRPAEVQCFPSNRGSSIRLWPRRYLRRRRRRPPTELILHRNGMISVPCGSLAFHRTALMSGRLRATSMRVGWYQLGPSARSPSLAPAAHGATGDRTAEIQ